MGSGKPNRAPRRWIAILAVCLVCAIAPHGGALEPGQILLVTNRNVPEGQKLAEFYRTARQIPEGRIVALNLPRTEDLAYAAYEREVVHPIRQFLRQNDLKQQIKCVVTFYGVPLRVAARPLTADERQEAAQLQVERARLLEQVAEAVAALEAEARKADPRFQPRQGQKLEELAERASAAWEALAPHLAGMPPAQRAARLKAAASVLHRLYGPAGLLRILTGGDDQQAPWEQPGVTLGQARAKIATAAQTLSGLQDQPFDPAARAQMRALVAESFGVADLARVIGVQLEYLTAGTHAVALDSELALLWWDSHPRNGWQPNPLHYRTMHSPEDRAMMVMRLDAPQSGQVRDMILASLKAERDGLKGRVVLDSRGIRNRAEQARFGSYAWYDQGLRNLADLIRAKTTLGLLHEESPTVLPADSAGDVALYCGWYSVRNYVPACRLNLGAVGFHVASFELVSLRNPQEKGWVAGLLNDGAAATVGPVAEPFLAAFPPADDFFPLLLTGKLPLAEVYWRTTPTTGWMMSMIGDPLYRPYQQNPPLKIDDLPPRLGVIFDRPATRPATRGSTENRP